MTRGLSGPQAWVITPGSPFLSHVGLRGSLERKSGGQWTWPSGSKQRWAGCVYSTLHDTGREEELIVWVGKALGRGWFGEAQKDQCQPRHRARPGGQGGLLQAEEKHSQQEEQLLEERGSEVHKLSILCLQTLV